MTERKIIPVRVLELQVEDDEVLRRGTADRRAPTRWNKNSPKNTCVRVLDDQGSLNNDDSNGSEHVTQKVNSRCLKLNRSFSSSF